MLVSLLRDFKLSDFTLISSFPDWVDGDIILIVSDSSRHHPSLPYFVQHVTSHLSYCVSKKNLNPDPDLQMDTQNVEEIN